MHLRQHAWHTLIQMKTISSLNLQSQPLPNIFYFSLAWQLQRAKVKWSDCCQMTVQGSLWLAKCLTHNLFSSFGFYDALNNSGHWRHFLQWAWKAKFWLEVLLCAINLQQGTHGFTSLPKKSYSGFLHSEKIHWIRPGLNLWTSDPVASMIPKGPVGSTPQP